MFLQTHTATLAGSRFPSLKVVSSIFSKTLDRTFSHKAVSPKQILASTRARDKQQEAKSTL